QLANVRTETDSLDRAADHDQATIHAGTFWYGYSHCRPFHREDPSGGCLVAPTSQHKPLARARYDAVTGTCSARLVRKPSYPNACPRTPRGTAFTRGIACGSAGHGAEVSLSGTPSPGSTTWPILRRASAHDERYGETCDGDERETRQDECRTCESLHPE